MAKLIGLLFLLSTTLMPAFAQTQEEPGSGHQPDPRGRNPLRDTWNAARTLGEDALHIYSAPARMDRSDGLKVLGWLAAAGLVYTLDDELSAMAHRNEDATLLQPFWDLADFVEPVGHMGNTNAYYFGGVAVGYVTGLDRLSLICAQILEAHFIAGLGKNLAQAVVRRPRPFQGYGSQEFGVDDATSFPSGHAINIFQLATILSHHVDRRAFTWSAYLTAGLVGVQRVRSDMHWSSDVLLSAVWGTAVARAVLRLHEERALEITPHASALGMGLQVGWRF